MAESLQVFAAEPMALFEDADQFIADEYFNNRQTISTDSEHSSSDENEEDISATQATFMDPYELDLEEMEIIKQFSKCTKRKGGPCSTYFNVEELADHRTKKGTFYWQRKSISSVQKSKGATIKSKYKKVQFHRISNGKRILRWSNMTWM